MALLEVHVTDDPAGEAAGRLVAAARAGGHVVLAGGSTPRHAYELAASALLDWAGATLWYGDDRAVGPDDPRSNHAMVAAALCDRVTGAGPTLHRIEGELGAEEAAERYETLLRSAFGGDAPAFDLVLLGIGPDRHTASLFPGKPALEERDRWAVAVPEAGMEPYVPRVTLTVPALAAGREVVFLAAGEDKAEAVAAAFGDSGEATPAGTVAAAAGGRAVLVCDAGAASRLEGGA